MKKSKEKERKKSLGPVSQIMTHMDYFYGFLAMFLPEQIKERYKRKMRYAGIYQNYNVLMGKGLFLAVMVANLLLFLPVAIVVNKSAVKVIGNNIGILPLLKGLIQDGWIPDILKPFHQEPDKLFFTLALPLGFIGFIGMLLAYELYLFYRIEDRTKRIEQYLPDFLYVVVSNLQSGMPPFAAFVHAAKPEFGPLAEEVHRASAKVSASQSLVLAFRELSDNINSETFRRTVTLFEKGVRTGGRIAPLLLACAEEMKKMQNLQEHMSVSVQGYFVFLIFIVAIIAPFLFTVGDQFLASFVQLRKQVPVIQSSQLPMNMFLGEVTLTVSQLRQMVLVFLLCDSVAISLLIGSLQRGKPLYGLKYAPVIFVVALLCYFISSKIVSTMFVF